MNAPYASRSSELGRSAVSSNAAPAGSTSAMWPRNRRLVSTQLISTEEAGPSTQRAQSPIPSRHPSRIASTQVAGGNTGPVGGLLVPCQDGGLSPSSRGSPTSGFGKGLWEGGWTGSWSALQGLASSVLGVEVGGSASEGEGAGMGRKGGDSMRWKGRGNTVAKKPPATWGPNGSSRRRDDNIGAGSSAARDLVVKARKTASILESHDDINGGLDANGNYKRRSSLERPITPQKEEDSLVYVHHVQPQDTVAGVVLKYNCQLAPFRKANRLWPNDSIQIRQVVYLPVDACGVKGKPCDAPSGDHPIDLLAPTPDIEDPPSTSSAYTHGGTWSHNGSMASSSNETTYTQNQHLDEEEQPWIHIRWVLIDSSPSAKPVEVARLPRKHLGYFPPRRRKSQATISSASSPRSSSNLQYNSHLTEEANESTASKLGSKSDVGSYFPSSRSSPLPRRDSKPSRSRGHSLSESAGAPKWMRGPGGVGTLSKDVRIPGPPRDSLNEWATKHAPILGIGHLPSSSAVGAEIAAFGFNDELASISEGQSPFLAPPGSGAVTPRDQGGGMGLENAAAAIEGWVRRLATKAPGTPRLGIPGKAAPPLGEGDLIELLDGAGSDDGRAFESTNASSARPLLGGSSREDLGPSIRSRMSGKGKSD